MTLAVLLAVVAVVLLLLDMRRIALHSRPSRMLGGAACLFVVFALAVAFVDQAAGRVIP